MATAPELIAIARIIRPRGVQGDVVADILTDRAERWENLSRLRVETLGGESFDVDLVCARVHQSRIVLTFRSCRTRADAERLRGALVKAPALAAPSPDPDTFYHYQLVGCGVKTKTGETIGRVRNVCETGGAPLLEVIGDDGSEHLIPFVTTICPMVDVTTRLILIDPPEGLLDLTRSIRTKR